MKHNVGAPCSASFSDADSLFRGFPLQKKDRMALDQFSSTAAVQPKGVAGVTLTNLRGKAWIEALGCVDDGGWPLYLITKEGRRACEMDDLALASGRSRPAIVKTMHRSAFQKLEARLEILRGAQRA